MQKKDIPNIISVLRIFITVPVVWGLLQEWYEVTLVLFAIAGFSDGLDGFLAKHYGWQSRLGGYLDPLADKVLLVSCFFALGWLGHIPYWLVAVIVFRDLLIVAGAITYHFQVSHLDTKPSLISKLNTFLQIMLVFLIVLDKGAMPLPPAMLEWLIWTTLATTVMSGVGYVWMWSRLAAVNSESS